MGIKDKLFGNEKKSKSITISIPDESLAILENANLEGAHALMVINQALNENQNDQGLKQVFGYYCSIVFDYIDVDDNLWPSDKEFSIMQNYVEIFDKELKGNPNHPNALFVAKVTHKGTCQMIWMLHNSQTAIEYLDGIIAKGNEVRPFDYLIEEDPEWESIEWFLQDFPKKD